MTLAAPQTIETTEANAHPTLRTPCAKDGMAMHQLAKDSAVLDVNSEYAYVLLGAHFADSCAVAEADDGRIVAFASAYIPPTQPDALFVWQIAVDADYRKQGLGLALLQHILERPAHRNTRYVQATIAPSNQASRRLFHALADRLGVSLHEQEMFLADHFHDGHEAEPLIVVGPLTHHSS